MTSTFVRRAVLGAALVAAISTSGCSSSGSAATPSTMTAASTTTSTATATSSPGTASATAGPSTADARNLPMPASVRAGLVAAFAAEKHLRTAHVAGPTKGRSYYGYVRSTGRYWAVADFEPTAQAMRAVKAGSNGGPLRLFDDGPFVFSRRPGASWRYVSDTGGTVCPPTVPAGLLDVWKLSRKSCTS